MDHTLLSEFGNPIERVENAIEALRQGKGILVLDDEDRENEGDLIFAAETTVIARSKTNCTVPVL